MAKCSIVMTNGDRYEGESIDNIPNGKGTMWYAGTGVKYEGDWSDGQRHGRELLSLLVGSAITETG
jgi:hypothetical protein